MPLRHILILGILFFVSGAAALIYQVVWVRELGLLFGSTAEAAALAIAIFFLGIASGGAWFGSIARRVKRPLRWFALLELGVALTALGHFFVVDSYFALYPGIYALVGAQPVLEMLVKGLVAATILLPSAFLMGGTLPMMGQHLIRHRDQLGRGGSGLYAINTAGGAVGALAAGFTLPMMLGFSGTYLLAVGLDVTVGLCALWLARSVMPRTAEGPAEATTVKSTGTVRFPVHIRAIAFLSGFVTLAVEIIWTRLFAQVLQNSVYTYALVLTTFLAALALGSLLANMLSRLRRVSPDTVLVCLLLLSAGIVALTPAWFFQLTNGLAYLGRGQDFPGYVREVARIAVLAMLIPGMLLGAVLPYLLRLLEHSQATPGEALGRLIAANTSGAILGALSAGFLILPTLGAWRGLWWLGAVYLALAAVLILRQRGTLPRLGATATAAIAALLLMLTPGDRLIRVDEARGEQLLDMAEGRSAHVAVIERDGSLSIRVNNYYTLGSSGARIPEQNQALIPLLQHPAPKDLFFLGMGTGISAGAGLFLQPERVTVCEILPDVVRMAQAHFVPYVNGLFDDPRVTLHAEDGRHCLARSRETYDAIVADLFTPWKAGTGNLYTLDHYRMAAERLNVGGLYIQWIPLYQVSRAEFDIIANTMAQAFPQVTVWRGDLYAERSIVALVGHQNAKPLDSDILVQQSRSLYPRSEHSDAWYRAHALRFYAGNAGNSLFADASLNTDNFPVIEYQAPRTQRAVATQHASWLTGSERDRLYEDLLVDTPVSRDAFLHHLGDEELGYVEAGRYFTLQRSLQARGQHGEAFLARAHFRQRVPVDARKPLTPAELLQR